MSTVGYLRHVRAAFPGFLQQLRSAASSRSGKVTLYTIISGGALFLAVFTYASLEWRVPVVNADDVTTSVHILNTPPLWTVDAEEKYESSVTSPSNVGTTTSWVATATDSNNDSYYLLICKTSGAPTATTGGAPHCNGGDGNQWAISGATASGAQATAATTTWEVFPESNAWYAWICDNNASLGQCNATYKQGTGATASPFIVNHPPVFASVSNDAPKNPGQNVTWSSVVYDTDTLTTNTVRILLCKSNDFSNAACGVGGTWATSTLAASNPSTSTPLAIPTQDSTYNAYAYVVDAFNLAATSTVQGTNSSFVVSNVAPTVSAATMSLVDPANPGGDILLDTPSATSGPYRVEFIVTDNNSCQNISTTAELTSATTSIYRSGIGQSSCQLSSHYNTNSCYPSANTQTAISCVQDSSGAITGNGCSGASDTTVGWVCTFSLWYNADPTDGSAASDTQYYNQNWVASVQVTDDDAALSPISESTTGNDVDSFMAFNIPETSIGFGDLSPGDKNDPLATTTTLIAIGNVGLDQTVYGDTMCTTWSAPDSCDTNGIDPTNDIPVLNQKVATSSVAYAASAAYALSGSSTPVSVLINVPKTTATATPQQKSNYWGINIPSALTVAGYYYGQDTITAVKSDAAHW